MDALELRNSDASNLQQSANKLVQLTSRTSEKRPGVRVPTKEQIAEAETAVEGDMQLFLNSPVLQRDVPHHGYSNAAVKALRSMYALVRRLIDQGTVNAAEEAALYAGARDVTAALVPIRPLAGETTGVEGKVFDAKL